ncbi:hypothetical protein O3P69_014259 [Scylla paramamosain]|uniref:Ionotropic glutamate receptor L-glutamate and glycine-binding domain-containing protein n=1 Tax=Scylla paramamosain TaxID=85552 RepID=A0AAW0TBK4_SCYPA
MSKLKTILYLFFLITTTTTTITTPHRHILQDSLARTLQEVLQGPLERLPVTLLLQKDLNESYNVNVLLKRIRKDVTVIMTLGDSEVMEGQARSWPLWRARRRGPCTAPLPSWSPSTLLLLKVGDCKARRLLQTPLAQRTPALALLCLSLQEEEDEEGEEVEGRNSRQREKESIYDDDDFEEEEEEEEDEEEGKVNKNEGNNDTKPINEEKEEEEEEEEKKNEKLNKNKEKNEKEKTSTTKPINKGRTKKPKDEEEHNAEQHKEGEEEELTRTLRHPRVMTWLPFSPGGPRFLSLGAWSERAFPTFHSLFPRRFESLGGAVVGVASDMDDAPLVFRDEEGEFDGTSRRLLDVIASRMNFSYTLTDRAPDNKWGELENGTWVGLLGEVYRGNKHLAINYFTITEERARFFDYSVSYLTEGFGFALPIPPELPKWTKLVYPFAWDMWAAVGGATLAATAALLLLSALQLHPHPTRPAPTGLAPSLAFVMKGLVSQAQARVPGPWSVRMFLGGWWLVAFVVDIAYTGCLIAVLTVPSYPARIHALAHLALSRNRLCMLDYGEFVPDALLASEDRVMRTLGERMDLSPTTDVGFYGQEACAERVLAGISAHVETYAYLKITYVDMGLGDRVYIMREQVYEGNLAFFFRKHTPWVAAVDRVMRAVIEAGFVEKWQADILEGLGMTGREDDSGSRPQPLGLAHLQGAFLLFGTGLGVALVVLLL